MAQMSVSKNPVSVRALKTGEYLIKDEPYYEPVNKEIDVFEAAFRQPLPVLLKGPIGCGKTHFMRHMAWRLKRLLITVLCHDDLTVTDPVGRYLITANETAWVDGPMARAVRIGAMLYLDEIVEARKDTTVILHPLADDQRVLCRSQKPANGSPPAPGRGEYGIEDTRMSLMETKRAGVHPLCITIDETARDHLPHRYGAVNWTRGDDVRKLPLKVSDIYRRLTLGSLSAFWKPLPGC